MNYDYKTYESKKFYKPRGLSGLKNLGNSCYINSSLSVLGNCLGLTHYFVGNFFSNTMTPKNLEKPEQAFLKHYINVLAGLYSKNQTVSPKTFLKNIHLFIPSMEKGKQNDAYECIIGILDLLHRAMSLPIDEYNFGPIELNLHHHLVKSKREFYNHFKEGYSVINELFFGQYIQKVKCLKCNRKEYSYEPFMSINLPILQEKDITTVYDLLDSYFKRHTFQKKCTECGDNLHSSKSRIIRLPKYLIIHLKRFDNKGDKINKTIPFSSELGMSEYTVLLDSKSVEYELLSVVNHVGTLDFGHYYNFNKTVQNGWIKADDSKIESLDPLSVCTNNAYVLIYELMEF